jgi:hypothetical protein
MRPPTEFVTNVHRKGESINQYKQRYLDSVPFEFQAKSCHCTVSIDSWHRTQDKSPNGLRYDWRNGVPYHWDCGKIPGIWTYLEYCFSCGEMYIVPKFPDRMMICGDCGG